MFLLIAILLFTAAEFLLGWWSLPVVGLILGLIGARRRLVSVQVAVAAAVAWGLLLAWTGMTGNLGTFMQALAQSMSLPTAVLAVATVALPLLLAGLAARLGAGMRPESNEIRPQKPALNG
ncbi:MAG: hypothetical protein V4813_06245 [Gemmatimonadota bacterium]